MNRRGFFARVVGVLAAGLSRPWWMRSAQPTLSALGCIVPGSIVSVPHGLAFTSYAADLWVRAMSFPGSKEIADRISTWDKIT